MANVIIEELIDLTEHPEEFNLKDQNTTFNDFCRGDIQGNAILLLFFMLSTGVCQLPKEDYRKLAQIYYANDFGQFSRIDQKRIVSNFHVFTRLLQKLERGENFNAVIRLLGDTLADRGSNDLLTLLILKKLHELMINFEINISNHDMAFIEILEKIIIKFKDDNNFSLKNPGFLQNYDTELSYEQSKSFYNMLLLLVPNKNSKPGEILQLTDIINMYEENYRPHLRLITYSVTSEKEYTYFGHAPFAKNKMSLVFVLNSIAKELKFKPKQLLNLNASDQAIQEFIDAINERFQKEYAVYNKISTLFLVKDFGMSEPSLSAIYNNPINFISWNRSTEIFDKIDVKNFYALFTELSQEEIHPGFMKPVCTVHGHTITPTKWPGINLDNGNLLGKSPVNYKEKLIYLQQKTQPQCAQKIFQTKYWQASLENICVYADYLKKFNKGDATKIDAILSNLKVLKQTNLEENQKTLSEILTIIEPQTNSFNDPKRINCTALFSAFFTGIVIHLMLTTPKWPLTIGAMLIAGIATYGYAEYSRFSNGKNNNYNLFFARKIRRVFDLPEGYEPVRNNGDTTQENESFIPA